MDKKLLQRITEDLLAFSGLQGKNLSILLTDNKDIRILNKKFFNKDRPTNVISFSYMNGFPAEVIGDIVISVEKAGEEAEKTGVHVYERITALIIHGLLHILGLDHEKDKNEARRMRYREKRLFHQVASRIPYRECDPLDTR